jgi:lysophospholipase L1-like esterase
MANQLDRNWIFLGDSLTEGVGSVRATYVTELAQMLRADNPAQAVHDMRLRRVDPQTFNPYIKSNLAGFFDEDPKRVEPALWIWNLAAEGRTIEDDLSWLPVLRNLQPERIVIYRGSLESIIRPAAVRDGSWPRWIPSGWRGFVAMDPQCYFSTTWYRRVKQSALDALKQRARYRLLAERPGRPYMDRDVLLRHYASLLDGLKTLGTSVHVLGLIPPDESCFPGSPSYFSALNEQLRALAALAGAEFIDWAADINVLHHQSPWRYRDGFHPNMIGARLLARVLRDRIAEASR